MPMPPLVAPPPAPQSELEGLQAGQGGPLGEVLPPSNLGANGHPEPTRVHPDMTRHPTTKKFTQQYKKI